MILQFDSGSVDGFDVPDAWTKYVFRTPRGIEIVGDTTGYRELYVHCGRDSGVLATSLGEVLDHLRDRDEEPSIDPFGVSSLLHHALIPVPYTVYEGVHFLSMGDSAKVAVAAGGLTLDLSFDYPWTVDKSSNDRRPDPAMLLRLLTEATERQLDEFGRDGFLMLSSGKDSPAIALALAEGGFKDIRCVTYSSGEADPEPPIAADICRRLGLQHEIVEMPTDADASAEALMRFFTRSASPGVDLSQIPYSLATFAAIPARGAVFDGGGNDSYMGYPVSGHDLTKLRFRIRGRALANAVQRVTPVDSPLNYFARSRSEATLPGRTLRFRESRQLYPEAVDTSAWWYEQSKATRDLDTFGLCGVVQERHIGPGGSMLKQRLAADAIGMGSAMPWCDDEIADYYFNLPEAERYDRKTGKNKLLLRRMLHRYLDYDADAIGKHYFEFDGAGFIERNMEFVRGEIDSCALWDDEGRRLIHGLLDQIAARPMLYHSLLTVFMVSGWHNHSQYLSGPGREAYREGTADVGTSLDSRADRE